MKINTLYSPDRCCSTDETRYNLMDPWLDVEEKLLLATDGRRLVAVPVEVEKGEKSRFLSRKLLRLCRRAVGIDREMEIRGETGPEGISVTTDQDRGPGFPRSWKEIRDSGKRRGAPGTVTVGLDAAFLLSMARAMGRPKGHGLPHVAITIDITSRDAPLVVTSLDGRAEHGTGWLMPCAFEPGRCIEYVPPTPEKADD